MIFIPTLPTLSSQHYHYLAFNITRLPYHVFWRGNVGMVMLNVKTDLLHKFTTTLRKRRQRKQKWPLLPLEAERDVADGPNWRFSIPDHP